MIWDCPTWRSNQRKNILTNTNCDLTYNKKTSSTSQHGDLNVAQVGVQPTNSMIYSETAGMTNIHRCNGDMPLSDNRPPNFKLSSKSLVFLKRKTASDLGYPHFEKKHIMFHHGTVENESGQIFKRYPNINTKYIKKPGNSGCSSLQHHVL